MHFIPPSIKKKGLQNHTEELGYDYAKLLELFKTKATDAYITRALQNRITGNYPNRNTVAKWRKVYKFEKKKSADEAAMDELRSA